MATRTDADRAPRTPLSRERVLHAAMALADESGIEALSMRRLGQELGVEAMSLYNHVANKDDLLAGIADLVLSEIELPSGAGDWRTAVRESAISAHDVLRRHSWACSLAMSPPRLLPARTRLMEWMLRELREGGFSADLTYHAYHAVDSHIWGFTLWALGHSITRDDVGDLAGKFLREFPADEYPYMAEHVKQHIEGVGSEGEGTFAFVLDLILDSLERLRDTA